MKITDIMADKLISVHPKDKIYVAKQLMKKHNIRHLPVKVMNKLVGIVSLGDILFLSEKPIMHSFDIFIRDQKLNLGTIEEIMTNDVITVNVMDPMDKLVEIMLEHKVNAVPVVDGEDLVGLVTTHDMLEYVKHQLNPFAI